MEPDLLAGFPVVASALVALDGRERIVLVMAGGSRFAIGKNKLGERGWVNETDYFRGTYEGAFARFAARVKCQFELET